MKVLLVDLSPARPGCWRLTLTSDYKISATKNSNTFDKDAFNSETGASWSLGGCPLCWLDESGFSGMDRTSRFVRRNKNESVIRTSPGNQFLTCSCSVSGPASAGGERGVWWEELSLDETIETRKKKKKKRKEVDIGSLEPWSGISPAGRLSLCLAL